MLPSKLGKLGFWAQSCVSFQRANASGFGSSGSSGSGHSHASHFSAPRHRGSGARVQGTVMFSTPRHQGEAREVRVLGTVMRPFQRAKLEVSGGHMPLGSHISLSRERERCTSLGSDSCLESFKGDWTLAELVGSNQVLLPDQSRGHCFFDWPRPLLF